MSSASRRAGSVAAPADSRRRGSTLDDTIRELALHNDVVLTGSDHEAEIDALVRSMENGRLSDFLQTPHAIFSATA
jgi:hypothetical protein